MRTGVERTMLFVGLYMLSAFFIAGCATNWVSLRDAGAVRIEVIPSRDAHAVVSGVDVYQDGNELTVSGSVNKEGALFTTCDGHIDIAVIGPHSERVELGTAQYHHFPSRQHSSSFTLRFPVIAEKGTAVRLIFHRADGADSKQLHAAALEILQEKGRAAMP